MCPWVGRYPTHQDPKLAIVLQDCSTSEVRKAYKTRALQLHPDKNDAPDAEIQFRWFIGPLRVSSSYQCCGSEIIFSDPDSDPTFQEI